MCPPALFPSAPGLLLVPTPYGLCPCCSRCLHCSCPSGLDAGSGPPPRLCQALPLCRLAQFLRGAWCAGVCWLQSCRPLDAGPRSPATLPALDRTWGGATRSSAWTPEPGGSLAKRERWGCSLPRAVPVGWLLGLLRAWEHPSPITGAGNDAHKSPLLGAVGLDSPAAPGMTGSGSQRFMMSEFMAADGVTEFMTVSQGSSPQGSALPGLVPRGGAVRQRGRACMRRGSAATPGEAPVRALAGCWSLCGRPSWGPGHREGSGTRMGCLGSRPALC